MKRITFYLIAFFLTAFSWQGMAQFTESFDTEIPATWTVVDVDGGDTWVHTTTNPHSGAGQVSITYDSNAHDDYLISPSFTVTSGTSDRVSFYAAINGTTWTETFDVMLSTTAGNTAADFDVTLASETATSAAPNHDLFSYDLSAYDGQTVTIAVKATDTDRFYLYVDDFTVDTPPSCPDVMNITYSIDAATGTAGFSWDVVAGATGYNFEIQPQGTAQGTAGAVASGSGVPNASFNTTGLVDGTDYTLYVQTDCGGSGTANYISYDFSFILPPVNDTMAGAIPIVPSPEGTVCDAASEFSARTAGDGTTDSGMDGTCNGTDTGLDVFYTWTADSDALIWSGIAGGPGVVIRDTAGTEITCSQTLQSDVELTGWAIGDDLIIQVYDYGTSDVDVTFCLIKKMLPTCPNPSGMTVANITETTAEFDLTENGPATVWDFEVVMSGDAPTGTPTEDDVTLPYTAWTGTQNTDYDVYYRSDCGQDNTSDVSDWVGPVSFSTLAPPPANDDACNAEMLTLNAAPTVGNNTSSTGQVDEPSPTCWTDATVNSVWYSFVADGLDVTVTTDFDTPLNDTSIAVYSATDCADFTTYTEVGCDEDSGDAGTFGWNSVVDLSGLTDGETYYVQVEGYSAKVDEFNIQVIYTPPTNDNICDATPITVGDTSAGDAYTNFAATAETDEPVGDCFSNGIGGSVWFTFIAPASGAVNVSTDIAGGTNTDTELAVYAAPTDCADATTMGDILGCDQDGGDVVGFNSIAFVASLVPGDTYYVQVDNWSSTFEGGTFGLEVQEVTVFNPIFTTSVVSDCANSQYSVDVDVTNLGSATTVTVTDGTTTNANVGTGVITFGPYADGTSVDFTVTSDDDATYTSSETVQYYCPPANDLAADAIPVACGDSVNGDTSIGATVDMQGDCGSVDNDAPNLWYSFTGTGDAESVTASLCGSSYDTSIAIFTGTPGALTCYANNDDSCSIQSEVTFVSDGVQTYYIMVEGYNASSVGTFTLAISCEAACTPAVTNQDCANALAIVIDDAAITSDNTCATVNVENPSCDSFGTIADVWFSFVAPAAGITQITTTLGTATDINLAVYEGACGSLVEVAGGCMDAVAVADTINFTEGDLVAGNTYYVQAWNSGSTGDVEEGTFDIEITNLIISVPDCPTLVSPADGATDVLSPVVLDWDAATTGDPADSYNLYVSINGAAEFLFNSYTDTQTPDISLQPDLTVTWRVVPVNAAGENTACSTMFTFSSVVGTDDYDGDGVDNMTEYDPNGDGDTSDATDMTLPCDPVQAAGYTGYDATNTIWMAADCDGDGQTNDYEATNGSDPYDANSTTSVEELEAVGFEYYPNPVNSNLTVKANENITSIAIFNMLGQQVKQVNPSSLNAQIDMTNLANGTYFIKATVGEKVGTFKIVKK